MWPANALSNGLPGVIITVYRISNPKLNLVYYGSGNPSTWNPVQRPGDNKWSMSLWARDADTGEVKWVYQMTPHDEWDYDGINETVLVDQEVKGV